MKKIADTLKVMKIQQTLEFAKDRQDKMDYKHLVNLTTLAGEWEKDEVMYEFILVVAKDVENYIISCI